MKCFKIWSSQNITFSCSFLIHSFSCKYFQVSCNRIHNLPSCYIIFMKLISLQTLTFNHFTSLNRIHQTYILKINIQCTIYHIMITIVAIIDVNSSHCILQTLNQSWYFYQWYIGVLTTCLKPLLDINCNHAEFGFDIVSLLKSPSLKQNCA